MPSIRGSRKKYTLPALGVLWVCWLVWGCQHTSTFRQEEIVPAPVQKPCPPDQSVELATALEKKNKALRHDLEASKKTLAANGLKIQQQQQKITGLHIQLLEYEALVNDLRRRANSQQQRLEAAFVEVVRAKAKLHSMESKAEAVSTLAEAEIAIKELKNQSSQLDKVALEELSTAEQLLNMGIEEFKARNFGGALYLSNQSKRQVGAIQALINQSAIEDDNLEAESPFSEPLPLKILKKCNLRDGPGLSGKVIGQLVPGTLVVGYAYNGSWIRVGTQEGQSGWVFQSLIGAR